MSTFHSTCSLQGLLLLWYKNNPLALLPLGMLSQLSLLQIIQKNVLFYFCCIYKTCLFRQTYEGVYPRFSNYFLHSYFFCKSQFLSLQACRCCPKEHTKEILVRTLCFGVNSGRKWRPKIQLLNPFGLAMYKHPARQSPCPCVSQILTHITKLYSLPFHWTGKDLLGHRVQFLLPPATTSSNPFQKLIRLHFETNSISCHPHSHSFSLHGLLRTCSAQQNTSATRSD